MTYELYREGIGKYLFSGLPEVNFSARLSRDERALLDVHEHSHWMLANSTMFGTEQIALRYAASSSVAQLPLPIKEELERCLGTSADFSRLTYEGAALATEQWYLQATPVSVSPEWNSLLTDRVYAEALQLFSSWIRLLPYSPELTLSISDNLSQLCLDIGGQFLIDPVTGNLFDPQALKHADVLDALAKRSPDELLRKFSATLVGAWDEFVESFDAAVEPIIAADGFSLVSLRQISGLDGIGALTRGQLTLQTYETLREFGEKKSVFSNSNPHPIMEMLRGNLWEAWVRMLPGHQEAWPRLVDTGIQISEPSEERLRSDAEHYDVVRTLATRPPRIAAFDRKIETWDPVEKALAAFDPEKRKLYISINRLDEENKARLPSAMETAGAVVSRRYSDTEMLELASARAVIAPRNGFFWKFGTARYVRRVPHTSAMESLRNITAYNPAIAVPMALFDIAGGRIAGFDELPGNTTLGVLLEGVPLNLWGVALRRIADTGKELLSHILLIGPGELPIMVTFVVEEDATRWFIYMPLSHSHLANIQNEENTHLWSIPEHRPTKALNEIPMTDRFRAATFLICEQYLVNGL